MKWQMQHPSYGWINCGPCDAVSVSSERRLEGKEPWLIRLGEPMTELELRGFAKDSVVLVSGKIGTIDSIQDDMALVCFGAEFEWVNLKSIETLPYLLGRLESGINFGLDKKYLLERLSKIQTLLSESNLLP